MSVPTTSRRNSFGVSIALHEDCNTLGATMRPTGKAILLALQLGVFASAAYACGGELPTSCDNGDRNEAKWLLNRAVHAVESDKDHALVWFSERSHGYRTEDLYVFCIGPDNHVSAHPNGSLVGVDASKLVDITGKPFGAAMIESAKAGAVGDITYMWPRLERSKPSVKHTMFTRVSDQVCGVGYYE